MNWRDEADALAKALELVQRYGGGGPGSRSGKTAVHEALERYRKAIRDERNERESRKQTGLFSGSDLAGTLGAPYRPSVSGSETSLEAAHALGKRRAENLRAAVLVSITSAPGTDQEIAARLEQPENSIRPRRIELVQRGLVEDSGYKRKTKANRNAIVWRLAPIADPAGGNGGA